MGAPLPVGSRDLDVVPEMDLNPATKSPGCYTAAVGNSMALIDDEVSAQLRQEFEQLRNPVRLVVFSQALADPAAEQVARLVEETAALDSRLSVETRNFVLDKEKVAELGIARIPAVAVLGEEKDYGVRFYGLPSGYEFGSLVDAVLDVSMGESGLAPQTKEALRALPRAVHIQVFTTPT